MNISRQINGRAYDVTCCWNASRRICLPVPFSPLPLCHRLPPGGGGEGGVAAAASPGQIWCVHTEHPHTHTSTERHAPRDTRRALKQPRGLPRSSPSPALSRSSLTPPCHHHLTMPAPARGHAHSRTTAVGTGTRSLLTRSNAPITGFHPFRDGNPSRVSTLAPRPTTLSKFVEVV
jgi:hypothetical protein